MDPVCDNILLEINNHAPEELGASPDASPAKKIEAAFNLICPEEAIIDGNDFEAVRTQSPLESVVNLTPEQLRACYQEFKERFPNLPSPISSWTRCSDIASIPADRPISESLNTDVPSTHTLDKPPALVGKRATTSENDIVGRLFSFFTKNIWPPMQRAFWDSELKPLLDELPMEDQINLFKELNELDPLVPEGELANDITEIFHRYQIKVTILVLGPDDNDLFTYFLVYE